MTPKSRRRATPTDPATRPELDRIDRQILKTLQQDGRLSVTKLAEAVNLTVTPCFERVRRLEESGVITGYVARLDPEKIGLGLLAYVTIHMLQTTSESFERFKAIMIGSEDVLECHMVGGGFDYLLKVRVRNMQAFRRFMGEQLSEVHGVKETHTYFVMEEVKSTSQFPV